MSDVPYPDDDPSTIVGLQSDVATTSNLVTTDAGDVRDLAGRFEFGWDGLAADAAGDEIGIVAEGISEAEAPLQRYADALVDVRAAIDLLTAAYDDKTVEYGQRVDGARVEQADDPALLRTILRDRRRVPPVRARTAAPSARGSDRDRRPGCDNVVDGVDRESSTRWMTIFATWATSATGDHEARGTSSENDESIAAWLVRLEMR